MAQIKEHAKQIPFNISMPWGDSIAQYIGTSPVELTTNLPTDPSLEGIVGSTCSMIRDMAVKELIAKNTKAAITLSDICYGHGYVMHEGAMVNTGACKMAAANTKGEAILVGDGANAIAHTCAIREGDVFIKLRKFFGAPGMTPATPLERLKSYNRLGTANTTALGAADYVPEEAPAFLQQSSNEGLPNYVNPTLSGKGFTYNASPNERYDSKTNKHIFHPQGYADAPADAPADAAPAEEAEALGAASSTKTPIVNFDKLKMVTKMVVPEYVCSMICAGLNLDDIMGDVKIVEPTEEAPVNKSPQLNNPHMNTEEGMHINTFRYGIDDRVKEPELGQTTGGASVSKNYAGKYECEMAAPKASECMEKGAAVVHWIMERIINKDSFCDYETGNCDTLFAAAA